MPSSLPHNAYTYAPQQHPNLILGSLQLLFWLFFRPTAWRNHLKRIDPDLQSHSSLIFLVRRGQWQNLRLWRVIQGYLILPILANLILGLVLWILGESIKNIISRVAFGVAFGVGVGVAFDVAFGVAFGVGVGVAFGVAGGAGVGVVYGVAGGVAFGVAIGVVYGMVGGVVYGMVGGVVYGVAFGMGVGVAFGVVKGVAFGVRVGVAVGMAVGVGATINSWRPVMSYPFLQLWNMMLHQLDKSRIGRQQSLLCWNSAFWDEWQYLPLRGLDKHLAWVIEHYRVEGQAAIDYLSTSKQRWAVQSAQMVKSDFSDYLPNLEDYENRLAHGEIEW